MDDLARWLGEQLDTDAAKARAAAGTSWLPADGWLINEDMHLCEVDDAPTLDHIAEHDPARVLREIDAKRRTLVRCQEAMFAASPMLVHFAKQTLREMALGFSHRPGYEQALASAE